jgi:long-chain acyl-CoA synthetase
VNPLSTFPKRKSDEISTIIYTSGTTGKPKGVVHTFYTMISNIDEALRIIKIDSHDRFISYLPLSHVAERLLIELGSLYTGGEVSFAESIDSFKKNLQEIKPTVFLAVPRIWLKFQQGILQKLPQKKLNILLRVPILNSIIKRKIKAGLGLDQLRFAVTGAAAISKELLEWFDKLDIRVHEVYGMTENFGISSFNSPGKVKFGTVGTIFPYTEAKISLDGEILTRSKSIMVEYFKEPEKTNEMIDKEGWLHTGDLGEISSDGYLKITGRVKDLFKTSKGKYVSPTHIENFFTQCELIEQVCVVGSGLPQPIALVTLSDCGKKAQKSEVQSECLNLLKYINEKVQNYERLNNVVIINDEWSVDTGILTPTLKLKRNVVEKNYEKRLHTWVESSTEVIFQ